MGLIKWCLKNGMLLNLLTIGIVAIGAYKAMQMNKEAFPAVDFDLVAISTVYPGASPREVENDVTDLIEDEINGVDGIDHVDSTSIESLSTIIVYLDPERTDAEKVKTVNDLQRSVDRVQDLPDELPNPPLVESIDSGDMPVLETALTGDVAFEVLYDAAEELKEELEDLPDVKEAVIRGDREREYWVEVDPRRLDRANIGLSSIVASLQARNLNLPGGILKNDQGELLVRTMGEIKDANEIERIVLRTNASGVQVRIKDVAKVKKAFEERQLEYRTDGLTSINLLINKKASGDIIDLVESVKQTTTEFLERKNIEGLTASHMNDLSIFVRNRLGVLLTNGYIGIGLVLVTLLIFLSRGIALVAALGMPAALLACLAVMGYMGLTINLISMFALVIVLGMLVDDAIIVAENIWQYYEKGESAWDAAVKGASEVFWPVTATIMTTIAAFSPLLMVSGIFGKFIKVLPQVVVIALLASLLEAMLVLPIHAFDVLKRMDRRKKKRQEKLQAKSVAVQQDTPSVNAGDTEADATDASDAPNFSDLGEVQDPDISITSSGLRAETATNFDMKVPPQDPSADGITPGSQAHTATSQLPMDSKRNDFVLRVYSAVLNVLLTGRYAFLAALLGVFFGCGWWIQNRMEIILFPTEGVESFFVRVDLPKKSPLQATSEKMVPVEQAIAELPESELLNFVTFIGEQRDDPQDPFRRTMSNVAQVQVFLTPEKDRTRTASTIIEDLRQKLEPVAEANGLSRYFFSPIRTGPPVGKPVAIRISGDDLEHMDKISDQIQEQLAKIEGVSDIDDNFFEGKDEFKVVIDEKKAALALLSVRDIALHVRAAIEGQIATEMRVDGEQIPIRVRYAEGKRNNIEDLVRSKLVNQAGFLVPLKNVATFQREPGVQSIIHRDFKRAITVTASLDEAVTSSTSVNKQIQPFLDQLRLQHQDLDFTAGGEYEDTDESFQSLQEAFGIALGLIFLILATQFKSLTQPFVVMAAIPFGAIGVVAAFWTHNLPLSFLGFVGFIGLSGVVVNDSIVLVDFINKARARGVEAREAILYAGRRRFRAVWLTTLTTVFGLLPLVYGIGGVDKFLMPAATALGYGLIFGTVLVLFMVPALYMIRVDMGRLVAKVLP